MVSLDTKLKNSDIVEIIIKEKSKPSAKPITVTPEITESFLTGFITGDALFMATGAVAASARDEAAAITVDRLPL